MASITVRDDNTIEIPSDLADQLGIAPGSQVHVYHLGDTLSVRAKPSKLLEACDEFERIMADEGVTLDELLKGLDEERNSLSPQGSNEDSK